MTPKSVTRASAGVLAALLVGATTATFAQPREDDHRGPPPRDERFHDDHRWQDRRGGPPARAVVEERGAGPDHNFRRGGRLPVEYRSHTYVVDDWRAHRLTAPPRGYHWVQTGGDYVLAAIATGIIADILLNH